MKKIFLGFLSICGTLVILLTMVGCNAGEVGPWDLSPQFPAIGSIPDWPKAVREAIKTSPDLTLGKLDKVDLRTFRHLTEQIKGMNPRTEGDSDKGLALVDRANQLATTILPEWKPVTAYKLGTSNSCLLACMFVDLTNLFTFFAEYKAKTHFLNHGNVFSCTGFINSVWADTWAERALEAVENGSSFLDAYDAIDELEVVILCADKAWYNELMSYLVTNDPDAKVAADMLKNAQINAQVAVEWLNYCTWSWLWD